MYPIGVVGPGSERLVERLAEHLAGHGTVGVIANRRGDEGDRGDPATNEHSTDGGAAVTDSSMGDLDRYQRVGVKTVYGLDERGWSARGEGTDLREALYAIAPTCEFCIVDGTTGDDENPGIALPQVVLGDSAEAAEPAANPDRGANANGNRGSAASTRPILARAPDPEAIDLDELREALCDTEPIETLESLVERTKGSPQAPESGAIATFTGRVRAREGSEDTPTEFLEFEKYEGVAEERMGQISAELEERAGVKEVRMHHRSGRIEYGEDIVFVVVLAGHRGEAFETVEDGIDRLKAEVPIFKKEATIDEQFWVHDRP
ncbi:molybdopterin synthase [Halobacteriales archaeon QS_3_64_16]|nr:MAG: molybdopterin synthase [Halobacteriales archaeon QS_3_64_16]